LNVELALAATGLIDTLYVLQDERGDMDWQLVCSWMGDRGVATPLFVLFGYLHSRSLVELDRKLASRLKRAPKSVGPIGARAMFRIVDRCLDGGFGASFVTPSSAAIVWQALSFPKPPVRNIVDVPYSLAFPPNHPGRFTLKLQIDRLRSLLRYGSPS
jgi:hypothetical protein